jgi:hypothetical protein
LFRRQVPTAVLRQALSVALLGVALVVVGTLALLAFSGLDLDAVLFEASRLGPVTLASSEPRRLRPEPDDPRLAFRTTCRIFTAHQ